MRLTRCLLVLGLAGCALLAGCGSDEASPPSGAEPVVIEVSVENGAVAAKELESVPWRGIMAGADLDSALCFELADGETAGRRWRDADVDDFATASLQPGDDGVT